MNQLHKVEPHAVALEDAADRMDAAGIGGHPRRGFAVTLRDMAASLRAEAARGALGYSFDGAVHAAGDDGADPSSQRRLARPQDDARMVSIHNEVSARLHRIGLSGDKLDLGTLDRALADHRISTSDRIRLKGLCHQAGLI